MKTAKKNRRLVLLGLACLSCVVVGKLARTHNSEPFNSARRTESVSNSVHEIVQEIGDPAQDRIPIASRIPAVDDRNSGYPVQQAAFDSIAWDSVPVALNRIQSPPPPPTVAQSKGYDFRRPSIAGPVLIPSDGEADRDRQVNSKSTRPLPPWLPQVTTATDSGTKPIAVNEFQANRNRVPERRPDGFDTTSQPTENKTAVFGRLAHGNPNQAQGGTDFLAGQSQRQPTKKPSTAPPDSRGRYPLGQPFLFTENRSKPASATQLFPRGENPNHFMAPDQSRTPKVDYAGSYPLTDNGSDRENTRSRDVAHKSEIAVSTNDFRPANQLAFSNANHAVQAVAVSPIANEQARYPLRSASFDDPAEQRSRFTNASPFAPNLRSSAMTPTGNDFRAEKAASSNSENRRPVNSMLATVDQPESDAPTTQQPAPQYANASTPAPKGLPRVLQSAGNYVLAEEPKPGAHWFDDRPVTDNCVTPVDPITDDFSPDPICHDLPYDPVPQMQVYECKTLNATQRPLIELGRPWYQLGQLSPGYSWLGKHNNVTPQFLVYGDARTALASNTQDGDNISQLAFELNLDFNLKITSTERFHMFMSPLDNGAANSRWLLDDDEFVDLYDANIDFGFFEGDLGAIVGGLVDKTLPFDLPIALGIMPLVIQNGVWMEDAFLGAAATIPARTIPRLNVSNMDITFFAGYDKINSDAFSNDDSAAKMYGIATFIDAMNGYFEIDYAFLEDRTFDDRSYSNIGLGFTRRFGRLLSHSSRIIVNAGQSTEDVENTADGVLLLSENSLITGAPSTLVPYLNLFAGFDRPQSAARAVQAGGILRNTGILFETDGMTNYPTLDPTANDTYGGAMGINLLANDFSQQLVVEMAALGVMQEQANRIAPGPQYGVAFRYQLPLTNALIFRTDGMYGFLEDSQDVRGLRFELRRKF